MRSLSRARLQELNHGVAVRMYFLPDPVVFTHGELALCRMRIDRERHHWHHPLAIDVSGERLNDLIGSGRRGRLILPRDAHDEKCREIDHAAFDTLGFFSLLTPLCLLLFGLLFALELVCFP